MCSLTICPGTSLLSYTLCACHGPCLQGVDAVNTALLYQCKGLTANVSAAELAAGNIPSAGDPVQLTSAQAFSLSSRPGAVKRMFLDFDGHTTTGTNWNSLVGRDSIVTPPYDKDGSPSTWSADELRDIYAIWRAVSEDFAAFDVDVTTADPGEAALAGNGIRVAIGGSYSDWYGNPAGGVAYVGSFGVGIPCFIFPLNLGPNYAKYVWEAVSHEIGHTVGLFHDGVTGGTSYYSGQGDWAPIMVSSSSAWVSPGCLEAELQQLPCMQRKGRKHQYCTAASLLH